MASILVPTAEDAHFSWRDAFARPIPFFRKAWRSSFNLGPASPQIKGGNGSHAHAAANTALKQHAAAIEIQRIYRGFITSKHIRDHLERAAGLPVLKRARAHLHELLPRDGGGKLLPLSCPDQCFQVFGVGVYSYMLWMRLMKRVFFVAFLFSVANLVQNAFGGVLRQSQSPLSVHTLGNVSMLDASYGASEFLVLCTLLYGMYEGTSLVRRTAASMRKETGFLASDHAILLQLPPNRKEPPTTEEIRKAMEPYGEVRHVTVVHDVRDLVARMRERQALKMELFAVRCDLFLRGRAPNPNNYKGGKRSKDFWKQSETRAQLRERMKGKAIRLEIHDEESISMMKAPGRKPTGAVFVFFEEPAAADQALRSIASAPDPGSVLKRRADRLSKAVRDGVANASSSHLALKETPPELLAALGDGKRISAKRAPEPSDVLWQNLAAGPRERWWRQLRTSLVVLMLALIGTVIIAAIIYINREGGMFQEAINPTLESQSGLNALVLALLLQLVMVIPVTLGNGLIFWTVPAIADRTERHHTHGALELSIALKCTFFQVLNTVAAAAVFYLDPYIQSTCGMRQWYSLGGSLIVNILFGDFIFIQVLMDCIKVDVIAARTCIARTAKSQYEMNQIYAAPAGIYLAFRMQQAGKYLVLAPMFGSSIPALFLVAAAYFWLGSWIDRYNLLRRLAPPPATDERLTRAATLYIFPMGVVAHILMALAFFYQLPLIAECDKMSADDGPSPNASTATAPSLPPAAPPPTPTLSDDEWLAFRMLVVVASVGCFAIGYFVMRELALRRGQRFNKFAKARQVMRVIVGEANTGSRWTRMESGASLAVKMADVDHERTNPYVPPFPPKMLQEYANLRPLPKQACTTVMDDPGAQSALAKVGMADEENQMLTVTGSVDPNAVMLEPPPLPAPILEAPASPRIVELTMGEPAPATDYKVVVAKTAQGGQASKMALTLRDDADEIRQHL